MSLEIPKDIGRMLGEGETVHFKARQSRYMPGGKEINPGEIFVTNRRVIFYNHKLFGRGEISDLSYADIANTEIKKGIFKCDLLLKPRFEGIDHVKITGIKQDEAFSMNSMINNWIREQGGYHGRI